MIRLLYLTLLLSCCFACLRAEVVVVNGKDNLLLPADLVLKRGDDSPENAYAYTMSKDGHICLSETYQRVYEFDEQKLAQINAALLVLEHAYFKYVHQHAKITKAADGSLTFVVSDAREGMADAFKAYGETLKSLLDEKETATLKYFDIVHVYRDQQENQSHNQRIDNPIVTAKRAVTIALHYPEETPAADLEGERGKKIAQLQAECDVIKETTREQITNLRDTYQKYVAIENELKSMGVKLDTNDDQQIDNAPAETVVVDIKGEQDRKIAQLQADGKTLMKALKAEKVNRLDKSRKYIAIWDELEKMGAIHDKSYGVSYSAGEWHAGKQRSLVMEGDFLFYDRAYQYHVAGIFEHDADK